jgi:hypothetical protein
MRAGTSNRRRSADGRKFTTGARSPRRAQRGWRSRSCSSPW